MASKDLTHFKSEQDKVNQDFEKLILSLPREQGWFTSQYLYLFQHSWCTPFLIRNIKSFQNHFQAKDNDIVVATLPKSGTTWLKALTFAITHRNRFSCFKDHPLLKSNPHELVPFFELKLYIGDISNPIPQMIEPRIFGTHVPFDSLAKSINESQCKILYICRNPFDTFVSTWTYANKIRSKQNLSTLILEEAFESYCNGISPCGPFWDHNLSYLKESMVRPNKILFLKYEELKDDINFQVKRIANFLGFSFTQEEESNKVIENIINLCDFENMKELDVNKYGVVERNNMDNKYFFRKGEVGDWKNYLDSSMVEKLSTIIKEKFNGSINVFSDYII